ncbi:ribosome silencing factor [Sinimarinibacterium thermocellulolyticum]|uniref:Ribosomal silencing factor RsfS n=1 Tax=Sinimarinibacterium thermocellulolyticum TaxID=3170016 RepID=A0ABV2A6X8_9GAMM
MPSRTSLTPLTKVAIGALEDLKGQDIKLLDVRKLTTVADTMLICTGTSNRHVASLAENVVDASKKAGFRPMGIEGKEAGEWVLVDLGDVIVHVMQPQVRAHYQLEKLWAVDEEPVSVSTVKGKVPKKTAAAKKPPSQARKKAVRKASKTGKPAAKQTAVKKAAKAKKAAKSTTRRS